MPNMEHMIFRLSMAQIEEIILSLRGNTRMINHAIRRELLTEFEQVLKIMKEMNK